MVTWVRPSDTIERMSDSPAAEEYAHPVARAVADAETMLAECAGLPLWSLQDKDIDDLTPRRTACWPG
jgi:hypothetical protein